MKNNILEIIKSRRSTRAFKEEQVKDEEIFSLLDAGNFAPSGCNMQPWHFTVVQNQELIKEISDSSKELAKNFRGELINKMANNEKLHIFYNSPTVIILSYREGAISPIDDLSAATQNILLQGEALGLGTCWNGFVSFLFNSELKDEFVKKLGIPEGYTPYNAISVGYPKKKVVNIPPRKKEYFNIIK